MKKRYYIGLSSSFHDGAVAIVDPAGEVVFAEASERYLQDKRAWNCPPDHLLRIPELIKQYCEPDAELIGAVTWSDAMLRVAKIGVLNDLSPFRKLGDALSTLIDKYGEVWPFPQQSTVRAWGRHSMGQAGINLAGNPAIPNPVTIRRYNHHLTHAEYACASSPFEDAVCAVIDGFGEWVSISFFAYKKGILDPIPAQPFIASASLGMFYMMICNLCGFDWLKGEEWKVMGLAPYGRVDDDLYRELKPLVRVRGKRLDFGISMSERQKVIAKVRRGTERRPVSSPLEAANIARTGQQLFADAMRELLQELGERGISQNLVLTGGCALNSSWNGHILRETSFKQLHVPSAPGDDGNCIGAAPLAYHEDHPERRRTRKLLSPYLGTDINAESRGLLLQFNTSSRVRHLPTSVAQETAKLLAQGKIIGWMQGRAEFGPRALGHRSILADPRSPDMKDRINARVKFREEYRPFAPAILHEFGPEYFEDYQKTPYMDRALVFREEVRTKVPAVVHVDNTGRLQSVTPEFSERYYQLIRAFYDLTGVPLILNTSFNIMGKPIIHTIQDALGMFYTSGLDVLVIDDIILEKEDESRSVP